MFDIARTGLPGDSKTASPSYRVMMLDPDCKVSEIVPLPVHTDEAAKSAAQRMANGRAVEL